MRQIQFGRASGTIREIAPGLVETCYRGVLNNFTFSVMRGMLLDVGAREFAGVVRMDGAILFLDKMPSTEGMTSDTAPASLIVLPEHYDMCRAYADDMATIGVRRAVFLPWQEQLAYDFAARFVRHESGLSRLSPRAKPCADPSYRSTGQTTMPTLRP